MVGGWVGAPVGWTGAGCSRTAGVVQRGLVHRLIPRGVWCGRLREQPPHPTPHNALSVCRPLPHTHMQAPELFNGTRVDEKSDLYSLGEN